jgi:microcystin-dependent protein
MSNPYIGEIRMFAGNYAPAGWAFCNGQALPIAENEALFILLGTYYGGDGEETFRLPDLRGRLPMHWGTAQSGTNYPIPGIAAGTEEVTLTTQQIPTHTHALLASTGVATSNQLGNNIPASLTAAGTQSAYGNDAPFAALNGDTVSPVGGSQPHTNFQPYLCVNFIISLFGVFPSPT